MNDDQEDITEEQRLQQAQNAGTSSSAPAGGQASFSTRQTKLTKSMPKRLQN